MNHLDVVTGASLANPITARLTERLGSSGLEDGLNRGPSGRRTTGHERRTMTGTLLSSRNAGTNEQETFLLEFLGPSDRVGIVGVTAINDDITLFEMGDELLDERVDGITGLDKEDNFAWPLQLGSELLDGVSTLDFGAYGAERAPIRLREENKGRGKWPTFGFVCKETIDLGGGSVVGNDVEALVVDVQNEVLALLRVRICGENLCDREVINLTMTAKPMRPISPLEVDNDIEKDHERH